MRAYVFPVIGPLSVADIDTPAVLKVLEQSVAAARGYPAGRFWDVRSETATRVQRRMAAVLDWAKVRGCRAGDNPARWSDLRQVLPVVRAAPKHLAALPYAAAAEFMATLRTHEAVAARALEFTILTAARTGEAMGARWDEFDLDTGLWTVPAERMKAGKVHRVPLSEPVLELLRNLPREPDNKFLFIGARAGTALPLPAMKNLLGTMGVQGITVHGFRSTFRDWAAEQTAHPNHIVEMALAHTIGSAVERAYRRGELLDKRRALMQAWALYLTAPAPGVVVPIRAAR
jgi:integrase